jgi:hypothetical protein
MNDDRISNWFTTDSAALRPKEGTLFFEAVIEPRRETDAAGNEVAPLEPRPNLTLVREEDEHDEYFDDEKTPRDEETAAPESNDETTADDELANLSKQMTSLSEDEGDSWPWEDEVESSRDLTEIGDKLKAIMTPLSKPAAAPPSPAPVCREDDHSAAEDVILCEPVGLYAVEPIVEAQGSAAEIAMGCESTDATSAYALRTVTTPKRIGSGQLVPARLTWRPGDPFGGDGKGPTRFRWEVMLTSACVTAACGLGCIWLLRTLLA